LESASGVAVYPPELLLLERRRRAGSCNDSPFQNQSNHNKIHVIKNVTNMEYESEDDILCELDLV